MSFLAEEIERQMTAQGIDQTTVANRAGMSQGQISYWRNGRQTSVSPEQMTALQTALSNKPEDHAALLRAHLRDETFGLGTELVSVELRTPSELRDVPAARTKREKALAFLAEESVLSRPVCEGLIHLARCLGADL